MGVRDKKDMVLQLTLSTIHSSSLTCFCEFEWWSMTYLSDLTSKPPSNHFIAWFATNSDSDFVLWMMVVSLSQLYCSTTNYFKPSPALPWQNPSLYAWPQEKDDELCKFVLQYEEQLAELKAQHEAHIKELEATWKTQAEKMVQHRESQLQEEMNGLTQEWTKERRVRLLHHQGKIWGATANCDRFGVEWLC